MILGGGLILLGHPVYYKPSSCLSLLRMRFFSL